MLLKKQLKMSQRFKCKNRVCFTVFKPINCININNLTDDQLELCIENDCKLYPKSQGIDQTIDEIFIAKESIDFLQDRTLMNTSKYKFVLVEYCTCVYTAKMVALEQLKQRRADDFRYFTCAKCLNVCKKIFFDNGAASLECPCVPF